MTIDYYEDLARSIEAYEDLARFVESFGVATSFVDARGDLKVAPESTLQTIRSAFSTEPPTTDAPLICTPGRHHPELYGYLILEQGDAYWVDGQVDVEGYHILHTHDHRRRLVIAARELLPQPSRTWGWSVQLYAARTRDSWGIGDFRDLGLLARLAASDGAGVILVSPVHAGAPDANPQPSPYSPASRQWLQLLHVAPGQAPGAERVDLSDLVAAGRALNADRLIARDKVWAIKRSALERIFAAVREDLPREYTLFAERHGQALERFAIWSVIAEQQPSSDWRTWRQELRRPDSAAVAAFAREHAERVLFFSWCQWVADLQYAAACRWGVDIVADLAVGFDSNSADAWAFQDQLSFDFEIGCPPDLHNPDGQCWGLPPFNPQALVEADFAPFIEMVRAGLRHAGALRIDHVMQLWRLFWIPKAGSAADGVYVHYPVDALLAILRIEAGRAGAWVVGEDMGTVAGGVRETMSSIGMLGNRSAMRTTPHSFPELSLGASATHDQVTVAGLLSRSDAADLRRIGKDADFAHIKRSRRALAELAHLDPDAPVGPAEIHAGVLAQYKMVASAPSRIVVASLDDAAGVKERPNMPGTVDQYPNWRIALPQPVEDILAAPLARDLVQLLTEDR
jgi:4-alpha-glucanotransferase